LRRHVPSQSLSGLLGDIDLDGVIAAIPEHWEGWVIIEVDRASMDPARSAETSWAWVKARLQPETAHVV
jgi:sugar phosphate isomerase/epimerase